MDEVPPPARRCTRLTKAGTLCKLSRAVLFWPAQAPVPDPMSCWKHLTDAESAAITAWRAATDAQLDEMWRGRVAAVPACWSWPMPGDLDAAAARAREGYSAEVLEWLRDRDWRAYAMDDWHEGRCAICGGRAEVTDHDHKTGLVRGRLCRSCNTLEGMGRGGVFARYRERNPATMWAVRVPYVDPFTGEEAQPEPDRTWDMWRDNPMRNIGL
jgi:hypothetical protein